MPAPIDSQRDYLLEAIASLCRAALDALGTGIVDKIYQDPRNLSTGTGFLGGGPGLSIYRASQKSVRRSSAGRTQDVIVVFDYVLPQTRLDERELRWPALQAVWSVIENVVLAGQHASVVDEDDEVIKVLELVNAWAQDESSPTVRFGWAQPNEETFPFFRGQITVVHAASEVDVATLDDFLEHYTSFDVPEGDHAVPLATDTTILPAWGS